MILISSLFRKALVSITGKVVFVSFPIVTKYPGRSSLSVKGLFGLPVQGHGHLVGTVKGREVCRLLHCAHFWKAKTSESQCSTPFVLLSRPRSLPKDWFCLRSRMEFTTSISLIKILSPRHPQRLTLIYAVPLRCAWSLTQRYQAINVWLGSAVLSQSLLWGW